MQNNFLTLFVNLTLKMSKLFLAFTFWAKMVIGDIFYPFSILMYDKIVIETLHGSSNESYTCT